MTPAARLQRLAEWYESGGGFRREFEEGHLRIAADIRLALGVITEMDGIRMMTDPDDPDSYRADDREGCLDAVHSAASLAMGSVSL